MVIQVGVSFVLPDGFLSWTADAGNALAQWNQQIGSAQFTGSKLPLGRSRTPAITEIQSFFPIQCLAKALGRVSSRSRFL